MLIVLLNKSSVNRSFSNSMEGIDRLWYRPEVVFLSSFHAITTFVRHINWRSKNNKLWSCEDEWTCSSAKLTGSVSCIVQLTICSLFGVYDSHLPLASTCCKLPGTLALFAVLVLVRPSTIKIFSTILFILSSPMWEKILGPLSLQRSASDGKLGTRLPCGCVQIM